MNTMKYVLNSHTGKFVFLPKSMNHSDIYGVWSNAGFVNFDTNGRDECGNVVVKALCYGKSASLSLECGPEDQAIINNEI
jgi:hypothetical protein